jgi:hypothetical protein
MRTAVHVLTHATGLDYYYKNYFTENKPKNPGSEAGDYFNSNPEEIYPRIQDIRFQMWNKSKIAPGTKITPQMLEGYNNNNTINLREYYSPEELAKIMNEVASSSGNKKPMAEAKYGGGLLSKTVSCSSCGHSWKSVDGGGDPLHCHKCGGMVKMQVGGQQNLWNTNRTQWVDSVNNANMVKNFVQREYLKNGPSMQIPGKPGRSTHYMEESDGMVYPTVVQFPGQQGVQYLNKSDKNGAYNYAKKTGEFIKFPTVEQALWYASDGYKTGTGVTIGNKKSGGQHGGLDRWFAEKWVDVKTGKACGRQEGESRAGYPACRPSRRVSSQTPKTSSEMSAAEKAKFKRNKTGSERINYNHKRN